MVYGQPLCFNRSGCFQYLAFNWIQFFISYIGHSKRTKGRDGKRRYCRSVMASENSLHCDSFNLTHPFLFVLYGHYRRTDDDQPCAGADKRRAESVNNDVGLSYVYTGLSEWKLRLFVCAVGYHFHHRGRFTCSFVQIRK